VRTIQFTIDYSPNRVRSLDLVIWSLDLVMWSLDIAKPYLYPTVLYSLSTLSMIIIGKDDARKQHKA
jgi:hypothetical protein